VSGDLVPATYLDASRRRRTIAPEVRARLFAAMGLALDEAPPDAPVSVVHRGDPLPAAGALVLEDGTDLGRTARMPSDAPFGYHRLEGDDERGWLLITGPGRCHLPADLRAWGWTVQLATTRSRSSWGIGDLEDLHAIASWSAEHGAGFVAVSPLGAPNPGPEPEPSPYYPSTRRWGNPLHISLGSVPGDVPGALEAAGRALNHTPFVDRSAIWALKLEALERAWNEAAFDRRAFEAWRSEHGEPLERWATFAVLSEQFGPGWRSWPEPYRRPASSAVRAEASRRSDRIAFHAWVQWCFDRQLRAASEPLRRFADMPVGVDPGGFDAWDWQEDLAIGATIGVPPDRFNTVGQDWGMPPFVPHRLREVGYRPFVEILRAQLRHAGGIRLDHVLGLFRLWWVPTGMHPTSGAYVTQHTEELLEIVALESERAGAIIIGEDLGTVPVGVRSELRRRRVLSTRLVLFERRAPETYPRQSLATVTTHDLPTVAGILSGEDLEDQAAADLVPDRGEMRRLRRRVLKAAGRGAGASLATVVRSLHERLGRSPSMLVSATLEDGLLVTKRPNMPGTVHPQRANWSMALPVPVEELTRDSGVEALAKAMQRD